MYIQLVLVNGALSHIECHEAHLRLLCHSVKATKQTNKERVSAEYIVYLPIEAIRGAVRPLEELLSVNHFDNYKLFSSLHFSIK